MRRVLFVIGALLLAACGGGAPQAEPSYETHTTSADDETSGAESPEEDELDTTP